MSRSHKWRKPKGWKRPIPKAAQGFLLREPYITYVWSFNKTSKLEDYIELYANIIASKIEDEENKFIYKKLGDNILDADYIRVDSLPGKIIVELRAKKGKNKYLDLAKEKFGDFTYTKKE